MRRLRAPDYSGFSLFFSCWQESRADFPSRQSPQTGGRNMGSQPLSLLLQTNTIAPIDGADRTQPARLPIIDAARATALLAMFVYHFAWDLDYYELISTDIGESWPWAVFARLTAGAFLVLVGVSLVLAQRGGFRPKPFLRRLAVIGGAAALVTLFTWWLLPESFIYFGILHCIAVSSVLALPFLRLPIWIVFTAAAFCFLAPSLFAATGFDAPWLRWLGLMTYFPPTVDYVPLLPWFGAVLAGIAAARTVLAKVGERAWSRWKPAGSAASLFVWAGRHSLGIYLLHQPLFLSVLYVIVLIVRPV
jgi:uncharacterized membrane protein